jgi:hypothetical protein
MSDAATLRHYIGGERVAALRRAGRTVDCTRAEFYTQLKTASTWA